MKTLYLFCLIQAAVCVDFSVTDTLIDRIHTVDDYCEFTPELMFLAMKGDDKLIVKIAKLVPMATRTDCTCCAGGPGDLAAYVLARAYELDKDLVLLKSMPGDDQREVLRYLDATSPTDWSKDERDRIIQLYGIISK